MRNKENSFPICSLIWRPGYVINFTTKPSTIYLSIGGLLDLCLLGDPGLADLGL